MGVRGWRWPKLDDIKISDTKPRGLCPKPIDGAEEGWTSLYLALNNDMLRLETLLKRGTLQAKGDVQRTMGKAPNACWDVRMNTFGVVTGAKRHGGSNC